MVASRAARPQAQLSTLTHLGAYSQPIAGHVVRPPPAAPRRDPCALSVRQAIGCVDRRGVSSGGMSDLRVIRHENLVPYLPAWDEQRTLHADRVAGRIDDTVVLLEHEPVYTAGKRTQ